MHWDKDQLFPLTGLPKKQGLAFTHAKVVNALHDLIRELSGIQDQHNAFYAYLDEIRESAFEGLQGLLMGKAELARAVEISPLTISRIEQGKLYRMETKRKLILALGYNVSDNCFPDSYSGFRIE